MLLHSISRLRSPFGELDTRPVGNRAREAFTIPMRCVAGARLEDGAPTSGDDQRIVMALACACEDYGAGVDSDGQSTAGSLA